MTNNTTLRLSSVKAVLRRVDSLAPMAMAQENNMVTPKANMSGYSLRPSIFMGKWLLKNFAMA